MRLHKKIAVLCLVTLVIMGIALFFLEKSRKTYDICVSIFSGAFLTAATTIMFYFYEKDKVLNRVYDLSSKVYLALCNMDKLMGDFLPDNFLSKEITHTSFNLNVNAVEQINEIHCKLRIEKYDSFFKGKMDNIIADLREFFDDKLTYLRKRTFRISQDIIKHEMKLISKAQLSEKEILNSGKSILTSIIKIHEYTVSLKLTLDSLLNLLDNLYHFDSKWDLRKRYLENEANEISVPSFEKNNE